MKTTPKQYAISLYEAVQGASKAQADKLVENFVKVLRLNNNLSMGPRIIREYREYDRKQKGISKVKVTSSEKLPAATMNAIMKHFDKQVELEEAVDETLLGGIVLEIDENTLIDGSVKKKLENLKKTINQ